MARQRGVRKEYGQNVFINCPFDIAYIPIFNAIVFAVHDMGFRPRCALEARNAGQFRLDKILEIIAQCRYSIHDLSRTQLDRKTRLPRFNMPFELGLDLGCKKFGGAYQREKVSLILDIERYRYQKFISDISGQDIDAHNGDPRKVISIVRNWLRLELDPLKVITPGGKQIAKRYDHFRRALPAICSKLNWDTKTLPFADFSTAVAIWIKANPL